MKYSTIIIYLLAIVFALFVVKMTSDNIQLREEVKERTLIQGAFSDVLHRIWIDNPDYVENVLMETDEFCSLDSLVESDYEDTFLFWNTTDSITYNKNKNLICILK